MVCVQCANRQTHRTEVYMLPWNTERCTVCVLQTRKDYIKRCVDILKREENQRTGHL